MQGLLHEFPLQELDLYLPSWVEALSADHPIKCTLYETIAAETQKLYHIRDLDSVLKAMRCCEAISGATVRNIDLGVGVAEAEIQLPRELFYTTLSAQSGLQVSDDGDLMKLLTELSAVKGEYDKVSQALECARTTGYGIVMPSVEELNLEDPEIVKQGGRYGVRMKASAPSIHMIRADIETELSPIVGTEQQSEELIRYLLHEFEENPQGIWDSNMFGKPLCDLVNEGLHAKLSHMPEASRQKLGETLGRIINEGSGGLVCILL
jgi:stage IV sporulation protein A